LSQVETLPEPDGPIRVGHAPNAIVVPDYTLLRTIGEGAYGEVYLAQDILGGYHAAKIVHRRFFRHAGPFDREFNGLRRFAPISDSHSGFVRVQHVGRNDQDQYIYYVMEIADDERNGTMIDPATYRPRSLAEDIKERGALPPIECIQICVQIADALEYLHQHHLVHRDIKPANIIFVKGRAKLADIGLVTEVAGEDHSVSMVGTEGYMPPEGPGSPQADVFSLGKVLYAAVTAFHVSRYPELPTAMMEQPACRQMADLNGIILNACNSRPQDRFVTAAAFRDELSRLITRPEH
jgi:serine/threonine protein kinase